ncbi:multifunctional CCA addition/repair protein [Alteromonas flava]|uniref:multifunctional CCA addition/repair protein n=1 Tax=Alteromonas flava TaxID=2048003 RepID=UPI000C285625|nr:multifunctional CCA addition/repair protein [Alteromonas flava]
MSASTFSIPAELNGHVYLVGGAVRDKLLGRKPKDNDYVVVGKTPEQMEALGFIAVGADFPVFLHPQTKQEFALARTERKQGRGYKGFIVDANANVTLEQDLARRDLTINAMAMTLDGVLIDPFGGSNDLQQKLLRHTTLAFVEDPVRVLRIARFYARFGDDWTIHGSTQNLIANMQQSGELEFLVAERVWAETEKALSEPHPHLYFYALKGLGIFPEIEAMQGVEQPAEYHPEGDVLTHTMLALTRAAELECDTQTRFAVLMHDFGKSVCFERNGDLHGHEAAGLEPIKAFCQRWRVPNKFRELACLTSQWHTHCHRITQLKPQTLYKFLILGMDAVRQPLRFEQFLMACQCDAQGRGPSARTKPYQQAEFARQLVQHLAQFDHANAAKKAIAAGLEGARIGESVRRDELEYLKTF